MFSQSTAWGVRMRDLEEVRLGQGQAFTADVADAPRCAKADLWREGEMRGRFAS